MHIPPGYTIRPAWPSDVPLLPLIEHQANSLFADWNDILGLQSGGESHLVPVETLQAAQEEGRLWVAADSNDAPVGFALASALDGGVHLDEMDVHPEHGHRGLGSALLETVCRWAQAGAYRAVTLTTFRDVPWNGPFYARHGFQVLEESELGQGLARIVEKERQSGLRGDLRVAMERRI